MFSIFTHVTKPVRDTNSEPGLPVVLAIFCSHEQTKNLKYFDLNTNHAVMLNSLFSFYQSLRSFFTDHEEVHLWRQHNGD